MPGLVPSAYGGKPGRKGLKPSRGCAGSISVGCTINAVTVSACSFQFSVSFTGPTPTTYLWDFRDGNSSTLAAPSHTYLQPGIYNVTLLIDGGLATQRECFLLVECSFPCGECGTEVMPAEAFVDLSDAVGESPCAIAVANEVAGIVTMRQTSGCVWNFRLELSCGSCNLYGWSVQLSVQPLSFLGPRRLVLSFNSGCEDGTATGSIGEYTKALGTGLCRGSHILTSPFEYGFLGLPTSLNVTL